MIDERTFGRFATTARLVIEALRGGPLAIASILDHVRSVDGPIGPGSLYAAIARLERARLIVATRMATGRSGYRLYSAEGSR